jgi:cell division transport system permease protein
VARYQVTHPGFYFMSIFSLAILLVLSGLFLAALFFSETYTRTFREQIELIVEIDPGTSDEKIDEVALFLRRAEGVRGTEVEIVTSEDALAEVQNEIGEDALLDEMENPFHDMIRFTLYAENYSRDFISELSDDLKSRFPVSEIYHPSAFFEDVFTLLRQMRFYIVLFIIFALVVTGILIHHIMRLNVIAQRRQIRTMELVGAEPSFVRKPFISRGAQMALIAWLVSLAGSAAIWLVLLGKSAFVRFATNPLTLAGAATLLLLALAICVFSTWIAVGKSIGRSLSDGT